MEDYKKAWTEHFQNCISSYPAELLIRILKGNYPRLNFSKNYNEQTVLEIDCACGNNMILLHDVGFKEIIGMDITQELVDIAKKCLNKLNINTCKFIAGTNSNVPLAPKSVDTLVNWGGVYYLDDKSKTFKDNIREYSRVLKKDGVCILYIPKFEADVFRNSKKLDNDGKYFEDKDGIITRRFSDKKDLEEGLSEYFYDIQIAEENLDCFGKNYGGWAAVCKNKE